MKVSLEHYGIRIEVSVPQDDLNIEQVASLFAAVLCGAGFSPETIEKKFPEADNVKFDDLIDCKVYR